MTFLIVVSDSFSRFAEIIVSSPQFQVFGLLILFLWSAIPTSLPVPEAISLPLYLLGLPPYALVLIATFGTTLGNYFLYLFGRGIHRIVKGKHRDDADAENLLHKYRLPIFLVVPFLFVIGDIIMSIAGYERIGFKKILPFLMIGEIVRYSIGILVIMGIVKLPEFLNF